MKKILTFIFCAIFVVGCGYIPTTKVAKEILSDDIFVDVIMSKTDPQNTVAIKDAIRNGIVQRLGKNLSSKESADTYIIAKINSLRFSELTYDQFGYVTSYRADLSVNYKTKLKDGSIFSIDTVGDYDFRVSRLAKDVRDTSSVISDNDRYKAIENASKQAFDEFISALAIRGFKANEAKDISSK